MPSLEKDIRFPNRFIIGAIVAVLVHWAIGSDIANGQQARSLPPVTDEVQAPAIRTRSLPPVNSHEGVAARLTRLASLTPRAASETAAADKPANTTSRSLPVESREAGAGESHNCEQPITESQGMTARAQARFTEITTAPVGRDRTRATGILPEIPGEFREGREAFADSRLNTDIDAEARQEMPHANSGNPLRIPSSGKAEKGENRLRQTPLRPLHDHQSEYRDPGIRNGSMASHDRFVIPVSFTTEQDNFFYQHKNDNDTDSGVDAAEGAEFRPGDLAGIETGKPGATVTSSFVGPIAWQSAETKENRHPLASSIGAVQEERPGPPVTNAPHRMMVPQIEEPNRIPQPVPVPALEPFESHEPDLVQPPIVENQLHQGTLDPTQISREMFWQQFATTPIDGMGDRTEGYESLQAILNNGFWFGGVDLMYLEPNFQQNNAFVIQSGSFGSVTPVDFGFDVSWKANLGFQTNAGPAFKVSYWHLNNFSAIHDFSYAGGATAVTQIDLGDTGNPFVVGGGASPGSRLSVQQQMKVHSTEVTIYKDLIYPVARIRGNVGLRHVSLLQQLFAGLDDPLNGSQVVRNANDYSGVGPRIGIEYYRPIGHTALELQTGLFASLLFGRKVQEFESTGVANFRFSQIGKGKSMSIFDSYIGVQWNRRVSKCQTFFFRTALESQWWAGSDSAIDLGTDLGLYGVSFGFGITR